MSITLEQLNARLDVVEAELKRLDRLFVECPKSDHTILAKVGAFVCREARISMRTLLGRMKYQHVSWARQMAMYLIRASGYSIGEIALFFDRCKKDVFHNITVVENRCKTEPKCREQIERLKKQIGL